MATVAVFVDDAVRGRLPRICVETGLPAEGRLVVEQSRGGIGFAWLLILLGPIGWIALVVVAALARRETLLVQLPYSEVAVDRERRLRRMRLAGILVAACSAIAAPISDRDATSAMPALFVIVAIVAAVFALVQHAQIVWTRVGIRIDASRRWVTLSRVHPEFARVVEAAERSSANARDFTR